MYSLFLSLIAIVASPLVAVAAKPAYFLLAGDSTTAIQSANGGGWGDGFLNFTLANGSTGHNYGHDGATTASFRAGGDWATVISQAQNSKSAYTVYVTIQVRGKYPVALLLRNPEDSMILTDRSLDEQFGHNDQKNTSGVTLEQYQQNLENFASEAKSAGAIPVGAWRFSSMPSTSSVS